MSSLATVAAPRLVIAGVSSRAGKTTFTLGLCRALMRRELTVSVFKCGPDYLDPGHHRAASRRAVYNLDPWLMGEAAVQRTLAQHAADVSIIEGVMGLFDGVRATELRGSTAELAQIVAAPIVLVCDASGTARSLAAVVHGFNTFEPSVAIAGVIANRVGSAGHLALLRSALTLPLLGSLFKRNELAFAERHLGLQAAREQDLQACIDAWADEVEQRCDVPALLELARSAAPLPLSAPPCRGPNGARCRIGVAEDDAFHFYYDENLRMLERAGAELVRFSPLTHASLPDVDGVYIGGGYPELHAAQLASNRAMLAALRQHASAGKPIYAECGGLMYLAEDIEVAGQRHAMVGLVPGTAVMTGRLQALGYVEVELRERSPLGPAGLRFRGHQFRYSRFEASTQELRYTVQRARDGATELEGYGRDSVLASYVHAHWASNPAIPRAFVEACVTARSRADTAAPA